MEQFVDVTKAAEILGISRRRVQQLAAEGLLGEPGRVGSALLLHRADVERLAREGWPGRRAVNSDGGTARGG